MPASICPTWPKARQRSSPKTRIARLVESGPACRQLCGVDVGVIISDTFGRTWRRGVTDVAIGCAGVAAVIDLRGTLDANGRELWPPSCAWPTNWRRRPSS
jgi:F420-0:gamma-glutamyl ligase